MSPSQPRRARARVLVTLLSCALLAAVVASAASAAPVARAAKTCTPPKYPGQGYFTSLQVTGTSCTTGKKLALAYYRCRVKSGVKGRCTKRVLHYKCSEHRTSIPTEINARVTCKRGSAKVVHTYQQNT
jgi:hypothetical protein